MSQEVLSIKSDPLKVVAKSCWEIQRDGGEGRCCVSGQTNNKQHHNIFIYFHSYSPLHHCRLQEGQIYRIKSSPARDKLPT